MSTPDVQTSEPPRRAPAVWGNVPQRTKNFTGRDQLLEELRRRMMLDRQEVTAVLPHALHGYGGVGKTAVAVEYAYRYAHEYDLVWWVQADQNTVVTATLAALAPRLDLSAQATARADEAVATVLDALRKGVPYRRWLVVFDNADQHESIRHLLPHGPGHVLVTSRNHRWEGVADTVAVDVFTRPESLEFLHRRVPDIGERDANRLAEALGDLPLALEQAGALQAETGMSVDVYLDLLEGETDKLLGEGRPADYPVPVAAAWSVSVGRLNDQMPEAMDLLRRCAYFGPEPIPLDLLSRGRFVLGPPLRDTFRDPLLVGRAFRELGRYALGRIDNHRKTLQVHRLIQAVIRNDVPDSEEAHIRHEVHQLLAAADPGDPDDAQNWRTYEEVLPHVRPSGALEAREPEIRLLGRNVVRYLHQTGNYTASRSWAERALRRWTADSGEDDPDVLIMSKHLSGALRQVGEFEEAFRISRDTLEVMRRTLGERHEEVLILLNNHAALLRVRGEFVAAQRLDEEALELHRGVFGEHRRTFVSANNLAADYTLTGRYREALELDERTYRERLNFFGRDDDKDVVYSRSAFASDLRRTGGYAEARAELERIRTVYLGLVQHGTFAVDHPDVLLHAWNLAVARRYAGALTEAVDLARDAYDRYLSRLGEDYIDTLPAAVSLGNALRVTGRLEEAASLIEETAERYRKVLGPEHPMTYGILIDQAILRRQLGDANSAKATLDDALAGLQRRLWPDHHYALICLANLATTEAALGEPELARELGSEALAGYRDLLGADHPETLACAANLSLDLRSLGREQEAAELAAGTLARYQGIRSQLGENHTDAVAAAEGRRIEIDFEPPSL